MPSPTAAAMGGRRLAGLPPSLASWGAAARWLLLLVVHLTRTH